MTRRNRHEDLDFDIHVDPCCVSATADDELVMEEHEEVMGAAAAGDKSETAEVGVVVEAPEGDVMADVDNESMNTADPGTSSADEPPHVEQPEASAVDDMSHQSPVVEGEEASIVEAETPKGTDYQEDSQQSEVTETAHESHSIQGEGADPAVEEEEPGEDLFQDEMDSTSIVHHQASEMSDDEAEKVNSRRQSTMSSASRSSNSTHPTNRRTSHRTEALIHAAARDIVAQLGTRKRESTDSAMPTEDSPSYIAESAVPSTRSSYGRDESVAEGSFISNDGGDAGPEDAADSSSQHDNEAEDDVFSDDSPRSSMGSMDEAEQTKIEQTLSQRNITMRSHSLRISDIAPSDQDEDFIPTVRGTPRPPFRSPSSVRALQMSSPPPSILGTPRSSRRTPLPPVSRLGSPSVSAQYSPKKTPPRFKRATPPLVLLHVTLLPLRWSWGHVLDAAQTADLSAEAKSLREAWRQLQDRTGDTVSDRGILLPHPQNDYEVLEERLLEALELPLRRRARILECGHYLGPANEMSLPDDVDSEEDEYDDHTRSPHTSVNKTHWCRTCRSEIRVDSLGQGKVFRVKVYASNGLMRAGAWEACWKEMERVDVELEPIIDADQQDELAHLALEQERALQIQQAMAEELTQEQEEEEGQRHDDIEHEQSYLEQDEASVHELLSSPLPEIQDGLNSAYDDRRARDEERLREIYGHAPPAHTEASSEELREGDFFPREPELPSSPSLAAIERREGRHQAYKNASLPELVLEAAKVLMQDKKNVMIGLLSILIMMLAIRGGTPQPDPAVFQTVVKGPEPPLITAQRVPAEDIAATDEIVTATGRFEPSAVAAVSETVAEASDPCEQRSSSVEIVEMSKPTEDIAATVSASTSTTILRVIETVTETVKQTVIATETISETLLAEATPSFHAEAEGEAVGAKAATGNLEDAVELEAV